MKRFLLAMGAALVLAAGCSSVVTEPGQTSGTTSGSGGASSTTSSTATGLGGGFTTSTGTGGAPLCDPATLFVDIEGDVQQHIDGSCGPMGSVLWQTGPKPPPPPKTPAGAPGYLSIDACTANADPVLFAGALANTWPADATGATITYVYAGATYSNSASPDGELVVTTFEPTGGVIEGTFTAVVTRQGPGNGPMQLKLTGKFRVCHGNDSYTV
jgi:hypothetical protein